MLESDEKHKWARMSYFLSGLQKGFSTPVDKIKGHFFERTN